MSLKCAVIMSKLNLVLNGKYEKDPDFSKKRKDWAFFVSVPMFLELKGAASDFLRLPLPLGKMKEVELEILGCKIFASDGIEADTIYFGKILDKEN